MKEPTTKQCLRVLKEPMSLRDKLLLYLTPKKAEKLLGIIKDPYTHQIESYRITLFCYYQLVRDGVIRNDIIFNFAKMDYAGDGDCVGDMGSMGDVSFRCCGNNTWISLDGLITIKL